MYLNKGEKEGGKSNLTWMRRREGRRSRKIKFEEEKVKYKVNNKKNKNTKNKKKEKSDLTWMRWRGSRVRCLLFVGGWEEKRNGGSHFGEPKRSFKYFFHF